MKIAPEELSKLKEQIALKNSSAAALGVAMVEYELEKYRITNKETELSPQERYQRLGAVQTEFDGYRNTHMRVVVRANARQKEIGEMALAALGLASKTRTFTIDENNGDVLELIAGIYSPVKEAA